MSLDMLSGLLFRGLQSMQQADESVSLVSTETP